MSERVVRDLSNLEVEINKLWLEYNISPSSEKKRIIDVRLSDLLKQKSQLQSVLTVLKDREKK